MSNLINTGFLGRNELLIYYNKHLLESIQGLRNSSLQITIPDMELASLRESIQSCNVSGDNLTEESYQRIRITGSNVDDIKSVNCLLSARNIMFQSDMFTEETIYTAWKELMHDRINSEKQQGMYKVSDREYEITECMRNMLHLCNKTYMGDILLGIMVHFCILHVRPMFDGNGRLARLLMQYIWYVCGMDRLAYLNISAQINATKDAYLNAVKVSSQEKEGEYYDVSLFISYMLETIDKAITTNMEENSTLTQRERRLLLFFKFRKPSYVMTVDRCANCIASDIDDAKQMLESLVRKQYLRRVDNGYSIIEGRR